MKKERHARRDHGAVSGGETTENYYDQGGNVVASEDPNGVWTKTVYNGDGEVSAVYTTDGGGDDPYNVTNDVVFSQQEFQYDADGNTILTTTYTRLATASASATGPLTASDSTVDYVADYYDSDDRQTDEADFGDNNGQVMSAPPPFSEVPAPGTGQRKRCRAAEKVPATIFIKERRKGASHDFHKFI